MKSCCAVNGSPDAGLADAAEEPKEFEGSQLFEVFPQVFVKLQRLGHIVRQIRDMSFCEFILASCSFAENDANWA